MRANLTATIFRPLASILLLSLSPSLFFRCLASPRRIYACTFFFLRATPSRLALTRRARRGCSNLPLVDCAREARAFVTLLFNIFSSLSTGSYIFRLIIRF